MPVHTILLHVYSTNTSTYTALYVLHLQYLYIIHYTITSLTIPKTFEYYQTNIMYYMC